MPPPTHQTNTICLNEACCIHACTVPTELNTGGIIKIYSFIWSVQAFEVLSVSHNKVPQIKYTKQK